MFFLSLPCPQVCQLLQVHQLALVLLVFLAFRVHLPVLVDLLGLFLQLPCLEDPVGQEALSHPALLSHLVHPEDPLHPKCQYARKREQGLKKIEEERLRQERNIELLDVF